MEPTSSKYKVGTLLYDSYYALGYISDIYHNKRDDSYEYSIDFFYNVLNDYGETETFHYIRESTVDDLYRNLQTILKESE